MMRLAQRAYPDFSYTALDQVAHDQFLRGLPDVDMLTWDVRVALMRL